MILLALRIMIVQRYPSYHVHGYVITTPTNINEVVTTKPSFVRATSLPPVTLPPTKSSSPTKMAPTTTTTPTCSSDRSHSSSRCCRYDLGLGKNQPVKSNNKAAAPTTQASSRAPPSSVFEATQYLVEHDAVKDYPSPTMTEQMNETSPSNIETSEEDLPWKQRQPNNNKKANLPKVQLRRSEEDSLHIYELQDNGVVDFEGVGSAAEEAAAAAAFSSTSTRRVVMIPASVNRKSDDDESNGYTTQQQQGEEDMISTIKKQMDLNTVWVEMLIHHEQNK